MGEFVVTADARHEGRLQRAGILDVESKRCEFAATPNYRSGHAPGVADAADHAVRPKRFAVRSDRHLVFRDCEAAQRLACAIAAAAELGEPGGREAQGGLRFPGREVRQCSGIERDTGDHARWKQRGHPCMQRI